MRVIVFCRDHPRHIYFANCIEETTYVEALVIQKTLTLGNRLRGLRPINQKLNELWKHCRRQMRQVLLREKDYFFGDSEAKFSHNRCVLKVFDINDTQVVNLVSKTHPDLILTFGCSIIRNSEIFQSPRIGIVNLHSGLVPDYRGVDNVYWCLFNNEPSKIGATIHYVDNTIDTGNILIQFQPGICSEDNEYSLFNKTIIGGVDAICKFVEIVNQGQHHLVGKKQEYKGHLYQEKHRNLWSDLKVYWFLKRNGLKHFEKDRAELSYYFDRKIENEH